MRLWTELMESYAHVRPIIIWCNLNMQGLIFELAKQMRAQTNQDEKHIGRS